MSIRLDEILKKSQMLYDDRWCQLLRVIDKKNNINGYTYLHEIRCDGQIISILPYRVNKENLEFLLRKEATPCWELNNPVLSSITGGVDKNNTIIKTALKELEEESGYKVYSSDMIPLGVCYGTKSTSTSYHLFSVNLTDYFPIQDLYIETEFERNATIEWHSYDSLLSAKDPFVFVSYVRLMAYLFHEKD